VRYPDWPQRLSETIEAARIRTFTYGAFDCALFAADCVLAITGVDHAASFRGYDSRIAAYRIIAEHGSLAGLLTALLGEPIEPAFAGRGDVVLAEIPVAEGEGESVGICLGAFCAFPKDVGFALHPRTVAQLSWRIR
jgi:hypothetical protein